MLLQNGGLGWLQDAIEPAQHDQRQHHEAILRGPVRPTKPVRNFPDLGFKLFVHPNVHEYSSLWGEVALRNPGRQRRVHEFGDNIRAAQPRIRRCHSSFLPENGSGLQPQRTGGRKLDAMLFPKSFPEMLREI